MAALPVTEAPVAAGPAESEPVPVPKGSSPVFLKQSQSNNPGMLTVELEEWLQERLRMERETVVQMIQERVGSHLDAHRACLLASVDEQLVSLDEWSSALPNLLAHRCSQRSSRPSVTSCGSSASDIVLGEKGTAVTDAAGDVSMAASEFDLPSNSAQNSGAREKKFATQQMAKLARMHTGSILVRELTTTSFVERFVTSLPFEFISLTMIILNTVIIAFEVQYEGENTSLHDGRGGWSAAEDIFNGFRLGFLVAFAVELILRVWVMRWAALGSAWIWFDACLVSAGVVELLSIGLLGLNPTMIRIVRLARAARMVRIFKDVKSLDSLFLLVKSIQASFNALVWSLLLLLVFMTATGMLTNQLLIGYIKDESNDLQGRHEVHQLFGTFSKAMMTMFEITFANWAPPVRTLLNNVSEWYMLIFLVYYLLFGFAVVNVIRAVFITETNRVALSDDEVAMHNKQRTADIYTEKLTMLFTELDADNSGGLSWEEFEELLTDDVMRDFLNALELDVSDLRLLFVMLDDGDGQVSHEEFVSGCKRMRGPAKSFDVLTLLKNMSRIERKLDGLTAHGTNRRPSCHPSTVAIR